MSANQFEKKSQAWSALFSEPMSELVKRYTASVGFDQRLWKADIAGSLAQCRIYSKYMALQIKALEAGVLREPTDKSRSDAVLQVASG